MNPLNFYAIGFIRIYQKMTEDREHECLHYPSCSQYAKLAYEKYGFLKATHRMLYRLKNCNLSPKEDLPREHWP